MCGVNPKVALASHAFLASSCCGVARERRLKFSDSVDTVGNGAFTGSYLSAQNKCSLRIMAVLALNPSMSEWALRAHVACGVVEECYLVDPASSHMLVSKIKPCMCKEVELLEAGRGDGRQTSWASCGLSGRAAWAFDGIHGLSVLRRWASIKACRRQLVVRPCAAEGIYLDWSIRVWCGNGSSFGRVASSRAPVTVNSRHCTHGARKVTYGQTLSVDRAWAVLVQELRHYSREIGRLSPLAFHVRGEPKSRSRVPRLPRFVVRWRGPRAAAQILRFGRRSGQWGLHRLLSICPKQMLLVNDVRARLEPVRARTGAAGSCGARRR
ncbi:hypothetical protein RDI58_030575 [Solanum bulbocastanum]|uniref:Uncharacterized protein n=1 Tax=Solanum bulbocastanum TaxID=147425 RepID=A0AAN8XXY3_SOLBU